MKLVLYYSSPEDPLTIPANRGFDFDEIVTLSSSLKNRGIEYEPIDSVDLSERELSEAYLNAMVPSVCRRYRIGKVFGSRRRSGWLFGKAVPGLLVYEEGGRYPTEAFPHEEQNRKVVTIRDHLENLLSSTKKHQEKAPFK